MLRYVVNRLLLIVPTIFLILILSFVLKSRAPGDEVAMQLELEGANLSLSDAAYFEEYRRIAAKYALDQPEFYFNIQASYFPDTLNRIYPKEKRLLLTAMLRQTKNWNICHEFNQLLTFSLAELQGVPSHVRVYNEIRKMRLDKSLSDIKIRSIKIEDLIADSIIEFNSVPLLLNHIDKMKSGSVVSWPTFRWNGKSNQFHMWLVNLCSRNNKSLLDGVPSIRKISKALKWTITMSLMTLVSVAIIALLLGLSQVYFRDGIYDKSISSILYLLFAVPTFWLATLFVIFFTTPEYGAWTDIFPSIGLRPSFTERSYLADLKDNLVQLILPVICMTLGSVSYLAIQLRSDLLDYMSRPFVLMAKAKGLNKSQVLIKHVLPNALIPYITILTGALPGVFAGSVIIEVIFNIPGVGRLLLSSMNHNDWPVVFTIIIIISLATIIGYLAGDLLLMKLYPKTLRSFSQSTSKA